MTTLDQTYLEIRSRICDAFLVWLSIAAIAMLAASLYRIVDIGWRPVMTLHLFVAVALWTTALCRKRLPYQFRAGFLLFLMLTVGLAGIWSFGLAAGGLVWLLITPVLGVVFFGTGSGLVILAGIILVTSVIGVMNILGMRSPTIDLVVYVTSASTWINSELSWVMMIGGTVVAIGILNKYFVESLETSKRQAKELGEGEREYRNILDNMVDTFYRTDQEGHIVLVSPSVTELVGFSPEELVGRKIIDFYTDDSEREEFLKRIQEGGGRVNEFESQVKIRDGSNIWASTSARYWKDADGNILGTEGTIRNITAHKTAEEALRRSQKMEAVGQLTGGIAHDYNNMLGVIMGNIQLVEGDPQLGDESKRRLGKAFAAAERNAELTNKLLGFSRSQAHGTQLTATNDFIENLEEVIAISLTASIRIETDLADNLWLVDVDTAELEDMILNLAINARDAMPEGGVLAIGTANKVFDDEYVRRHPGSLAGECIMISMSDTGTGMSQEIREKIFDPFFSTKETGKGTGLGLSMVYGFVQRSGGFIMVYSEPGEGTSFGIFLPRAQERASEAAAGVVADQEFPRGTETVLVVDDEASLIDLATELLEDLGYQTLYAIDGQKALDLIKINQDIDLLFSDVIMPGGLDGYDLTLAALKERPSLKVLLTSGFTGRRGKLQNSEDETVSRLATNLLSKPYTLSELAMAIRRTLDESD